MYLSKAGAADVSQTAGWDGFLIEAPFAGRIKVDACYVNLTEATQTMTVDGVMSLQVGGTEVGTCTFEDSTAIGGTFVFVVDGTTATSADPYVHFSAGDAILVELKTAATGQTVGDGIVNLYIEYVK